MVLAAIHASEARVSSMSLSLVVGRYKARSWVILYWHNVGTNLGENHSKGSKTKTGYTNTQTR